MHKISKILLVIAGLVVAVTLIWLGGTLFM